MRKRAGHPTIVLNRKLISFAVASCFAAELAHANPTGPNVVSGSAGFNSVGSTLTVTNSPNAIITWRGFSIGAGEATRFQQQSASSAVLNRVVGQDPSAILGTLWSNGRVFLINPNGILFGQGSRVDVAGLVASTLNITDADFLGGRLNFQGGAVANSIVNQGELKSASGGHIYLIASDITNSGIINSPQGEVVLAAGKSVSLVDIGTPNLKVEVTASDNEARNLGQIVADSGRIGVYAGLINQQGTVRADSVTKDATGKIVFRASDTATLGGESVISASGAGGGEIYVLARNTVKVAGRLDASAPSGGDGGFIETSAAHVHVDPAAVITTAAPHGKTGTWLVDPNDYTIASSGGDITGATLSSNLGTTSVIITSDQGATSGSGNINVNDTVSWSSPNSLTLLAHNNVNVNSPVTNGGTGAITMVAGWIGPSTADFSVTPGTGDISIFRNVQTGGNLSLIAGNNVLLQGATVAATNGQTVDGSVTVSAQAISINAGGSITIAAGDNVTASATGPGTNVAVATSNATLSATTTIDLTAVGGITVRGGNGTAAYASLQAAGSANNAATANANALVSAGTNLTISNAASVTLQAGSAQGSAWKFAGAGATLSGTLSATANANTTLQAGNSITINGGDLQIDAGFAQARAYESVFSATGAISAAPTRPSRRQTFR